MAAHDRKAPRFVTKANQAISDAFDTYKAGGKSARRSAFLASLPASGVTKLARTHKAGQAKATKR